jgi:hypothetical protein
MAVAGLMVAAAGCESSEGTPITGGGAPDAAPNVQATIAALAQEDALVTAPPTLVPPAAREAALRFAAALRTISQDWDRFHGEFDSWRLGLGSCDVSSVQVALRQFAGRFGDITETARALPRPAVVRQLADKLISAAEREEDALRLLRDTWRPGVIAATSAPAGAALGNASDSSENGQALTEADSQPVPVMFEAVAVARSAASALRKEVDDALVDREARAAPASQAQMELFSAQFQDLDSSWDEFHQAYDSFRTEEGRLTSAQVVVRLGLLVDRFRDIVSSIRTLPATEAAHEPAETLAQAAEEEYLALRRLRSTFQKDGEPTEQAPTETPEPPVEETEPVEGSGEPGPAGSEPSGETPAPDSGATFTVADPDLFNAFDAQLVSSEGARRRARQELADAQADVAEETRAMVQEFAGQHSSLARQWDDFHRDYDVWRRTEGGCDRSKAADTLGRFTVSFGEIATTVRGLPSATSLRPLGEILVQAAEREEQALRELRNAWRPYDVEVYRALDLERNTAGKLRRQVSVGTQELLERYGIPPADLD